MQRRPVWGATRQVTMVGAAACVAALAFAAPAGASFFASLEEPAGDSTDPANPDRDITAGGIVYNRATGEMKAAVRLAAAPGAGPAFVGVFAGTRSPAGCNVYPAVGFSAYTHSGSAMWHRLDGVGAGERGNATLQGEGQATQVFSATDDDLKGVRPNCAVVTLTDPGSPETVFDSIGPIDLVAYPELATDFSSVPERLSTGRSRQLTMTVRNTGDAPTGKVSMRFKQARGITLSPSRVTVKSIQPDRKRTVKVRVTASAKAARITDLTAIVKAGQFEARAETELYHRKSSPSRGGGGGGNGGGGGGKVCTRWIPDFSGESGGYLGLVPC